MAARTVQSTVEQARSVAFGSMIVRVEHDRDRPYLMISKATLADHSISFEARGFLCFLLTKPDDWRIRPEQLAKETGLSMATIYRLLKRLIDSRYVRREPIVRRKPDGTFDSAMFYIVFETRQTDSASEPRSWFDDTGIPF